MALTTPSVIPKPKLEAAFDAEITSFMAWAATLPDQVNTLSYTAISATSTTSIAIGTGSKTITLVTDVPFTVGMIVMCWNAKTAWMLGRVTSYTSGTKALIFTVIDKQGTGTLASWTISVHGQSSLAQAPSSCLEFTSTPGVGSTNTRVVRLGTQVQNVGTGLTHADSTTAGSTITVNEAGWYMMQIHYTTASTATNTIGLTLNGTEFVDNAHLLTNSASLIALGCTSSSATVTTSGGSAEAIKYLSVGDVIRVINSGVSSSTALFRFYMCKIG